MAETVSSADVRRWLNEGKTVRIIHEFADGDRAEITFYPEAKAFWAEWECMETWEKAEDFIRQITGQDPDPEMYWEYGSQLPMPSREWSLDLGEGGWLETTN